jgi:hypothetical protein
MRRRVVQRVDDTEATVVSVADAARLMGWREEYLRKLIGAGRVEICQDGADVYVFVDALWALVPEEDRRGG